MRIRQGMLFAALTGILSVSAVAANAAPREERYLGYAVDQASGRYLYTEVHRHQYDGSRWLSGSIRYVAPDGQVLGDKQLDFRANPYVPVMRYQLKVPAYEELITRVDGKRIVMEQRKAGKVERATLPVMTNQAADSGFNAFLVDHLDAFAAGREVPLRFAVTGQLDQYRFRVKSVAKLKFAGEQALRLRVEPDSLLRLLVDPIEVVYGLESRQLLNYRGVSNVLDPATAKAYVVEISYRDKPKSVPQKLPVP